MLLGAISQRFDTIVEFTAFENFYSFDKKGKNKIKRVENHKIGLPGVPSSINFNKMFRDKTGNKSMYFIEI